MKSGIASQSLIYNSGAKSAHLSSAKFAPLVEQRLRRQLESAAFVQVPLRLITDPRLSPADKVIYSAAAFLVWESGSDCREPMAMIAGYANTSLRQAVSSLAKLRKLGYIETARTGRRSPARISLTEERASKAIESEPCPECSRKVKLTVDGVCYACVREQRENVALREAREELGSEATDAAVRALFLVKMAEKKIRRVEKRVEQQERYEAEWTA